MAYVEECVCEICGSTTQSGAGWFAVADGNCEETGLAVLEISPFVADWPEHICSSGCLMRRVHQFEESLRLVQI